MCRLLIYSPTQLWYRGQPNHILPTDPRLYGPDEQVRHVLPATTAGQWVDVRRRESQSTARLWTDQGIQSHDTCRGKLRIKWSCITCVWKPLTKIFFSSEQRSSTACKWSHHLHRSRGRQRRDSSLHRERAGDGDGGRAGGHPGHQVGLFHCFCHHDVDVVDGHQVFITIVNSWHPYH